MTAFDHNCKHSNGNSEIKRLETEVDFIKPSLLDKTPHFTTLGNHPGSVAIQGIPLKTGG